MAKKLLIKAATRASVPSLKEGEYPSLIGTTAKPTFRCYRCSGPSTRVWETVVAGGRYTFCSGNCLYGYLSQRQADAEFAAGLVGVIQKDWGQVEGLVSIKGAVDYLKSKGFSSVINDMLTYYQKKYGVIPNTASNRPLDSPR